MHNNAKTEAPTEICNMHLNVNGQVERTIREDGIVKRVRRCDVCKGLFKTIEETEDFSIKEDKRRAELMEGWHRKVREAESIADGVKMVFEAVEQLKEQVRVAPGPDEWENEYPRRA